MEDLTGRQFGHYQIIAPLGEGGMAAVYKAYQPSMERYVAIKVLPQQFAKSPEFVARFNREAKLLAKLQHPHILPVFDFGEADGYSYIVMPYVESGTLTEMLKSKRLSLGEIRRIMIQLGDALRYAHARGMIHRDIKPSNVLIDASNNCLLTDFGLARMTEDSSHLTSSGAVMGTPAYMSPEQGTGGVVDQRSDLYSLGIILYEMVTGRVPYTAETPIAIVFKHIQDPLPPARTLNPSLPEAVELVLLKSLAKNPIDRYQNAEEFVQAIQRAILEDASPMPSSPTEGENAFRDFAQIAKTEVPEAETAVAAKQPVVDDVLPATLKPAVPSEAVFQATMVSPDLEEGAEPASALQATLISPDVDLSSTSQATMVSPNLEEGAESVSEVHATLISPDVDLANASQATLVSPKEAVPVDFQATLVSPAIASMGAMPVAAVNSKKPFPVVLVAGIGVFLLVVIGVLAAWFAFGSGTKPVAVEPTNKPTGAATAVVPLIAGGDGAGITIWLSWEGKRLETARTIFKDYEATHPGVKIMVEQVMDIGGQLAPALAAGKGPDIIDMPNDNIGLLAPRGDILALSDLGLDNAFMQSTFEPAAIHGVTWQGKIWGVPHAQESIAIIYNSKLVSAADFPIDPNDFKTLLSKAADYAKAHPGQYLVCNPGLSSGDAYHTAPIYFGFGVPGYVDEQGNVNVDGLQAVAAGNWIKQFRQYAPEISDYGICQKLFLSGEVAAFWTGMWELPNIQANGISYEIVPMGRPFVGIRTLMATKNVTSRGNGDLVLDVLKFFTNTDNAVRMGIVETGIPANSVALKSPIIMALKPVNGFIPAIIQGIPMDPSPYASLAWGPMGEATAAIWTGNASPSDALARAKKIIEEAIGKTNMSVPALHPFRDDFDGSLVEGWEWVRENKTAWSLTSKKGWLEIMAGPGYVIDDTVENLLLRQAPAGNFELETRLEFSPLQNFQVAGLIIKGPTSFIQFGRAFCDLADTCVGNGFYIDAYVNGNMLQENFATTAPPVTTLLLKLRRENNKVTAYFSPDGKEWTLIGEHPFDAAPVSIGLISGQAMDVGTVPAARFDYFMLVPLP